jgi:glycosyltransferase involved in cell wall biosynthesis
LFNKADALLLYSAKPLKVLSGILKDPSKIFVAENSIDTSAMDILYKRLAQKGKEAVKNELGWKHTYNLIFVGRLLKSKGLHQIIDIFERLPDGLDIALHIVGDGQEMPFIKQKAGSNKNIFSYGACYDDEKVGKFFYAADLLLMPKAVGLTIVHSFSFGCPIISCENTPGDDVARHGPEFEYLMDGINGLIVENDFEKIALEIAGLLNDKERYAFLSAQALNIKDKASLENMAAGFNNVVNYLNSK